MERRTRICFRSAVLSALLLTVLTVPTWSTPCFQVLTQRTFGAAPGIVKYTEYENNGKVVSVMILDPKYCDFSVVYTNPPMSVGQFHERSPHALLTVNGGYWDINYRPTDLCIADGRMIKAPNTRNRHFGLFAVNQDGSVVISDLAGMPVMTSRFSGYRHALKSGPHVIRNGHPLTFKAGSTHMRTVIAKNLQGEVLFVVNRVGAMTYSDMAAFLMNSELGITEAFNLDGGRSSGFVLGRGPGKLEQDSWQVANVIQVAGKTVR